MKKAIVLQTVNGYSYYINFAASAANILYY